MTRLTTLTLALLALTACSRNACEFRGTGADPVYYCWQGEEQDFCESAAGAVTGTFHPGQSCADLGYTYHCTSTDIGEDALQDEWTAGDSCDSTVAPAGPGPGGPCLVGTWDTDPQAGCLDQFSTVTYAADGTGITYTPECTGQCDKEDSFVELTWSASAENAGTLTLTYGRTVTCGVENPAPPLTVGVDFTCDGNTAVIDGVTWHRR